MPKPSKRIKELIGSDPENLDQAVAGIIKYLDEEWAGRQKPLPRLEAMPAMCSNEVPHA